jgi:hypothetical protein
VRTDPSDAHERLVKTRSAVVTLSMAGWLRVRILPDVEQTVEDAEANLAACTELSEGRERALILDLREAHPLEAPVRHIYRGPRVEKFSAIAVVVAANPFGVMMGNVYLRVARPKIPTHLFHDPEAAARWLESLPHG